MIDLGRRQATAIALATTSPAACRGQPPSDSRQRVRGHGHGVARDFRQDEPAADWGAKRAHGAHMIDLGRAPDPQWAGRRPSSRPRPEWDGTRAKGPDSLCRQPGTSPVRTRGASVSGVNAMGRSCARLWRSISPSTRCPAMPSQAERNNRDHAPAPVLLTQPTGATQPHPKSSRALICSPSISKPSCWKVCTPCAPSR